jgi:hypothetical protein
LENALMLAGQPVKRGTMAHDHDVYMTLTDTAAQQYDAAGIALYAGWLEELAQRDQHRLYLAIALRARGIAHRLAGEPDKAEPLLRRALERFQEMGTRWQSGRTLTELGEVERARQNVLQARDYFARAVAEFEAVGALPAASRVRVALEETA